MKTIRISSLPTIVLRGSSSDYYWDLVSGYLSDEIVPSTFYAARGSSAEEGLLKIFEEKNLTKVFDQQKVVMKELGGILFTGHVDGFFHPVVSSMDGPPIAFPVEVKTTRFTNSMDSMMPFWGLQASTYAWASDVSSAAVMAVPVVDFEKDAIFYSYKNSAVAYPGIDERFAFLNKLEEGWYHSSDYSICAFSRQQIEERMFPAVTLEYMNTTVLPRVLEFLSCVSKMKTKLPTDIAIEFEQYKKDMDEMAVSEAQEALEAKTKELEKVLEDRLSGLPQSGMSVQVRRKVIENLLADIPALDHCFKDYVSTVNYKSKLKLGDVESDDWVVQGLEKGYLEKVEAKRTLRWKNKIQKT